MLSRDTFCFKVDLYFNQITTIIYDYLVNSRDKRKLYHSVGKFYPPYFLLQIVMFVIIGSEIHILLLYIIIREELNVGTVPMFKMHNIGTVPTFKMHNVGTVPTYKMYNIGTVPTFKMHNVGTLVFLCFFF